MKLRFKANILDESNRSVQIEFQMRDKLRKVVRGGDKSNELPVSKIGKPNFQQANSKREAYAKTAKVFMPKAHAVSDKGEQPQPRQTFDGQIVPEDKFVPILNISVTKETAALLKTAIANHGNEEIDEEGNLIIVTDNIFIRTQISAFVKSLVVFIGAKSPQEDLAQVTSVEFVLQPYQTADIKNTIEFRNAIKNQRNEVADQLKKVGAALIAITATA